MKTTNLIAFLNPLLVGCSLISTGSSIPEAKPIVETAELTYCDVVHESASFDGQTIIIAGTLRIVIKWGVWMHGADCDNDDSAAAVFAEDEEVKSFLANNKRSGR